MDTIYDKYKYSLEKHLKFICEGQTEYINLYATWELDRKLYNKALLAILFNYPHYSLHDGSHSESIINKIEVALGEDRIKTLGPTETWMILQVAYLHDFGMVLQSCYIEEQWKTDEFQEYIKDKCEKSTDKDLQEACRYISTINDLIAKSGQNGMYKLDKDWPVKIRQYVIQIISMNKNPCIPYQN